ncbi:MAG: FAD-binding protein [Lachnospiraceae bacterium]|jgi:flavin-dependent dehydrogenase
MYDIAVVGAGPAASTFAREVAPLGLSVILIGGKSKPCGGLLAPDAQKIMASFDFVLPKDVLVNPQIFSVKTMDLVSKVTRSYQRYYLNMDRSAFDAYLLSLVPKETKIVKGRCIAVSRKEEGFSLKLASGEEISCRMLVGADGAGSIVRRSLFDVRIKQYIAIQQWFSAEDKGSPYYSCIFDHETSESCSWMIHKDSHLIYGGCFNLKGSREAFEKQKKRVEAFLGTGFGEAVKTEACLCSSPRHMRDFETGRNSVFLIGEAAGFISPSSFEGLSYAMESGSMLASAMKADISRASTIYFKKTVKLRYKLMLKAVKHRILFTPFLRHMIMKSGLQAVKEIDTGQRDVVKLT